MKTELVTTLKRQATRLIAELQENRDPVLITEHGRPAAYLVDVESYELQQKRMRILEGIARGEQAIRDGRTLTQEQAR
ncbi:MAG TPA: type II toxin-antitoxin system Phd/YefM family antitoxin, partial [Kiritimatiellia bacterium]|nr:type II toxin-antitoxin system Phd/YefM family antitoxin [Kiritimatiellia bacterium]